MDLKAEISKFIKHKVRIANSNSSHYLEIPRLQALQFCDSLRKLFCYQAAYLTKHDIARQILQNKMHLQNILPCPLNSSYKSSVEKLEIIIATAEETLKPKTQ